MFELVVVVASKKEPEQKANFGEIRVILCHRHLLPYHSPFPYLLVLNRNPGIVGESQCTYSDLLEQILLVWQACLTAAVGSRIVPFRGTDAVTTIM